MDIYKEKFHVDHFWELKGQVIKTYFADNLCGCA